MQVDGEERTVEGRTSNEEPIDRTCSARCKRHRRRSGRRFFCLRTTGVEDSPDRGGAVHHLARRVRIRAETTMEYVGGTDDRELFKVPIMIADVAELDSEAIGKRMRAGSQRKEEEAAKTTSQDKEDVLTEEDAIKEGPAKMPRLEDIEDVMMEESQTGPEGSPEKYVWGTGGAEMQPEAKRLEYWMKFTEDPRYNQERRVSLLKPLGVEAREAENLDQLLTYFPWPGSISIQMPAGQVWGLARRNAYCDAIGNYVKERSLRNGLDCSWRWKEYGRTLLNSIWRKMRSRCMRTQNAGGITSK